MKPDTRKCSWSVLSESKEVAPKVLFTPTAIKWVKAMVEEHSIEVGFLGIVEEIGDAYVITEIFYPAHCLATAATCEISPAGEIELAQRLVDENRIEDVNKIRFWGHSHHTMGTSPSGQDNDQAVEKMNSNGAYFIRAIANKDDEVSVSFFDYERQVKFDNIKWEILYNQDAILNKIVSISHEELDNADKVRNIKDIVNASVNFQDEEYKEIAEEVARLKKIKLPKEDPNHAKRCSSNFARGFSGRKSVSRTLLTEKEIREVMDETWVKEGMSL